MPWLPQSPPHDKPATNDLQSFKDDYNEALGKIEDDKAFIKEVNIGGEFISQEKVDRIKEIAEYRWNNEEGVETNFLNFDEVKCLSIARGTLTAEKNEKSSIDISM